jgi:hypothetical protein
MDLSGANAEGHIVISCEITEMLADSSRCQQRVLWW